MSNSIELFFSARIIQLERMFAGLVGAKVSTSVEPCVYVYQVNASL